LIVKGKIVGSLNNVDLLDIDVFSYVMPQSADSRNFISIGRVPVELGGSFQTLIGLMSPVNWLFAGAHPRTEQPSQPTQQEEKQEQQSAETTTQASEVEQEPEAQTTETEPVESEPEETEPAHQTEATEASDTDIDTDAEDSEAAAPVSNDHNPEEISVGDDDSKRIKRTARRKVRSAAGAAVRNGFVTTGGSFKRTASFRFANDDSGYTTEVQVTQEFYGYDRAANEVYVHTEVHGEVPQIAADAQVVYRDFRQEYTHESVGLVSSRGELEFKVTSPANSQTFEATYRVAYSDELAYSECPFLTSEATSGSSVRVNSRRVYVTYTRGDGFVRFTSANALYAAEEVNDDPCENPSACSVYAECVTDRGHEGNFSCVCKPGFEGNGYDCYGMDLRNKITTSLFFLATTQNTQFLINLFIRCAKYEMRRIVSEVKNFFTTEFSVFQKLEKPTWLSKK
jgi:hypothetical protein